MSRHALDMFFVNVRMARGEIALRIVLSVMRIGINGSIDMNDGKTSASCAAWHVAKSADDKRRSAER